MGPSGAYAFGIRTGVNSGVPISQVIQYEPGEGWYRDALIPDHSEDGRTYLATLNYGWNTVSMSVLGNRYLASVNGTEIFSGTTPLTCGGVFIRLWRGTVQLKDLTVQQLD